MRAAIQSGNILEELGNLHEIAFLVDDCLEAQKRLSKKNFLDLKQIQDGERDIEPLRRGVEQHIKGNQYRIRLNWDYRIFQFHVFVHLLEMEEGAFRFVQGRHNDALDYYLKG